MYLTQSNAIRGLKKHEYEILREMCLFSRNLYNVALYSVRQHYFAEKRFLAYESNYQLCKDNENYKMLQAGVAQQTLKVADRSFKSFFNLIKKAKNNEYRFQDIKMPHYLGKGELFPLILSTNAITIKDNWLRVPMSKAFMDAHPDVTVRIPFPAWLDGKNIKEVRIIPIYNGLHFKVQYVYEAEKEDKGLSRDNALGVDIGLDNLAACADSKNGTAFLMDGRKLKSINHFYNKRMAELQSVADKQGYKRTKRMGEVMYKRNNRCRDYIMKTARLIVNYCIKNDIGTVVVGYSESLKRGINLGKKTNQQFVQVSFGALREQLRNLCERYCMDYVEQEESYTSKASFLDGDAIPVYNPYKPDEKHEFSGRRVKRGLYRTSTGTTINADVNGALNILRKSKRDFREPCIGLLASPQRIRIV